MLIATGTDDTPHRGHGGGMMHPHTISTIAMVVLAFIATAVTASVGARTADRTVKIDAGKKVYTEEEMQNSQ